MEKSPCCFNQINISPISVKKVFSVYPIEICLKNILSTAASPHLVIMTLFIRQVVITNRWHGSFCEEENQQLGLDMMSR